jgi:hypothetical protein
MVDLLQSTTYYWQVMATGEYGISFEADDPWWSFTTSAVLDTDGDGFPDDVDNAPFIYNPDQGDVDGDGTGDVADPCPDDPTDTCNIDGSASGVIGGGGGSLETGNGMVSMDFPAGAVSDPISFSITDDGNGYEVSVGEGTLLVINSYSIQPNGTVFDVPITLVFGWDDANNDGIVDGTVVHEVNLQVIKDGVPITPVCSEFAGCDVDANTITVEVSSLSLFELAGQCYRIYLPLISR